MKPIIGIGTVVDYCGTLWRVKGFTKTHAILADYKNSDCTTVVALSYLEKAL